MSALDLPLREQAAAIAAGEADPGELLDACLARFEERNPELNAIVATFPDRSREMLAALARRDGGGGERARCASRARRVRALPSAP